MPTDTITLLTGFNVANVEGVKIVTEETTAKTYHYKTMTKFEAEPHVEEGEETVQRVKNTVMGRIKTEDMVTGYDLTCEDERLIHEVLALIDGGTYSESTEKYSAPVIGSEVQRTAFTLYLYTSNRGNDGEIEDYLEWKFPHCKGTPVKLGSEDKNFHKQEYKIQSRPATGASPFEVMAVDTLFNVQTT